MVGEREQDRERERVEAGWRNLVSVDCEKVLASFLLNFISSFLLLRIVNRRASVCNSGVKNARAPAAVVLSM